MNNKITDQQILDSLKEANEDLKKASQILGMNYKTLYHRVRLLRAAGQPDSQGQGEGEGDAPELSLIPTEDPFFLPRAYYRDLELALQAGTIPYLIGETGTGKSYAAQQYAARHRLPFLAVSFDGSVNINDLMGHKTLKSGTIVFREGILLKLLQNPSVILFDEINAMEPGKGFLLHQITGSGNGSCHFFVREADRVYQKHPECRIILASNPVNSLYIGTNRQNIAFLGRFCVIKAPYFSKSEIIKYISARFPDFPDDLKKQLGDFYIACVKVLQPFRARISLRQIINFVKIYYQSSSVEIASNLAIVNVIGLMDPKAAPEVQALCRLLIAGKVDEQEEEVHDDD